MPPVGLGAVVVKMNKNITRWLKNKNKTLSQYLLNFCFLNATNKYSNIQKLNAENTLDDLMKKKYQADD